MGKHWCWASLFGMLGGDFPRSLKKDCLICKKRLHVSRNGFRGITPEGISPKENQTVKVMKTNELTFITPPVCQGQMVTYSYASVNADSSSTCILRRRTEGGCPTVYELFVDPEWEDESSTNLEFWNNEPSLGELVKTWEEA
jgi:hypothetical protein